MNPCTVTTGFFVLAGAAGRRRRRARRAGARSARATSPTAGLCPECAAARGFFGHPQAAVVATTGARFTQRSRTDFGDPRCSRGFDTFDRAPFDPGDGGETDYDADGGTATTPGGQLMRLLWVTENYPPSRGGMAQSCDRIVRGLRAAGVEVDVAHLSRRDRPWPVDARTRRAAAHRAAGRRPRARAASAVDLWSLELSRSSVHPRRGVRRHVPAARRARCYAAWAGAPLVTLLRGNDFDTGMFSLRRQRGGAGGAAGVGPGVRGRRRHGAARVGPGAGCRR